MFKQINMDDFKTMFSNYCHNEVEAGNCEPDECQWCCINQAWNRIFGERFDNDYEDED